MKTIILSSLFVFFVTCATAQIKKATPLKKDSIALRADIEAISQGKQVKSNKPQSLVRSRAPQARIDTMALKPGRIAPVPSSPNNPNPHEAVPSAINAEPPATPPAHPVTPAGTPTGAGGSPKWKQ